MHNKQKKGTPYDDRSGDEDHLRSHSRVVASALEKKVKEPDRTLTGREQAERALQESEARYRSIVDAFDGLIYICSQDYRIEFMNDLLKERTGYDGTGQLCYRTLHGFDSVCSWCVNDQVFAGNKVHWDVLSPKDGRWYHVSNTPIYRANGKISKQAMITDITWRKETEDALRESEVKYRTLFEESFDGLFITSPGGAILDMNKKGVAMFGYGTKKEVQHLDLARDVYVNAEDRARILTIVQEHGSAEYEVMVKKKDGTPLAAHCALTAIKNNTGEITSYRGIIRDITERKKAEEDLKTNRIFLNNILNSIQDPLVVLDRHQNILMTNKTFEETFAAIPPPGFIGKSCHEVLFGTVAPCEVCLAEQSNLTKKASHKVISYPGATGGPKWYDVFAYPLFTAEGVVVGNVHHLRDITDHQKAEEKIVKDQEQLRSLTHQLLTSEERERQRISRELHDEMGQMLTGIKLNLQEVRQQANADTANKIGGIQQDIGDLMVRMRDLSARLRPSLLDDLGLLPALQWHIERFSKQTRVRVEFEHEGIERRFSHEVSLTLFRIVQESLTNAVRHSGAESVKISLKRHEGTIHVVVRDEGTGFDPEDALNRRATLGLAGMRERVEMVGGSLMISSTHGKGTEIRCSIPIDGALPHND